MIKASQTILFATAITTGLIAGLFYSWTVSVTPGIHKLGDREYLLAFQAMNKAILNPFFFLSFIGTVVLLPCATWIHFSIDRTKFYLLLAASLIYWIGILGVTAAGNVPMNESLAALDVNAASTAEISARRLAFESRWNLLNTVRTLTSISSFVLVIIACIRQR